MHCLRVCKFQLPVQQTGAGQLTLERRPRQRGARCELTGAGAFVAQAKQDLTVSGRIEGGWWQVELHIYR